MARYLDIAEEIRGLIRRGRYRPGEAMPSERVLARQYGISHSAIRMASDLLVKEGLIVREHGRGTFVAKPQAGRPRLKRRLGLIYVDQAQGNVPGYSQRLTLAIQACAQELGYELLIEQMRSADVMGGRIPAMMKRRSVDGVLLDGWITEAHTQFLSDQEMPYVATGSRPLGSHVPQVRPNLYRLARQVTRELIRAGRRPLWLDANPSTVETYFAGSQVLQGHMDELQASGKGDKSLRLCSMQLERTATAVGQLLESDLAEAAVIAQGWVWALVAETLIARQPQARQVLFVPLPTVQAARVEARCQRVEWNQLMDEEVIARAAVEGLTTALEGGVFQSISLEPTCRILLEPGWRDRETQTVRGEFTYEPPVIGPGFVLEESAGGMQWRIQGGQEEREHPIAVDERSAL